MLPPNNSFNYHYIVKNGYLIFPSLIYHLDEEEIKNKQKRRKSLDSSPRDEKNYVWKWIIEKEYGFY